MKIGMLKSITRVEEKYLLEEFKKRGVKVDCIDDRQITFNMGKKTFDYDVILERCVHHARALYALQMLNDMGIRTINSFETALICGDKLMTSAALFRNNVPSPQVKVAFTRESALEAIEEMGYPCVMKPAVGSWGRLITKINDRDTAESILEHKELLGSYHHSIFYIQEYMKKKNNRDIRSFVIGDECIAAIYRESEHWITNTARGGKAYNCPLTDEIKELSVNSAKAVKGDIVAVDLFETDNGLNVDEVGMKVNEVNYTMEFRNSITTTGVNIPAKIVDYVIETAKAARK